MLDFRISVYVRLSAYMQSHSSDGDKSEHSERDEDTFHHTLRAIYCAIDDIISTFRDNRSQATFASHSFEEVARTPKEATSRILPRRGEK